MSDRLLIALVLASILHALIILGVAFDMPQPEIVKRSMRVTLVQMPTREAPKKADFLAQDNQVGSGTEPVKNLPTAPPPEPRERPAPRPEPPKPVPEAPKEVEARPAPKPRPLLRQERSRKSIAPSEEHIVEDTPQPTPRAAPKLTAETLSRQIAELSAEIAESTDTRTRGPRIAYINSVNAQRYKAAAYEKSWQEKIERIGNMNYPDEARRQKISGGLLLSVGIRQDGSVYSIKVRHSSGHQVLDDAAVRIVRLAAPFAPFPEELKREVDVLVINRTWRFYNDYRLETSP